MSVRPCADGHYMFWLSRSACTTCGIPSGFVNDLFHNFVTFLD